MPLRDLTKATRPRCKGSTPGRRDCATLMPPTIWTIGHSNHTLEHFLDLLRTHAIDVVADVRSTPFSRRHPHFNRERLKAALAGADAGIDYIFLGAELGARSPDRALLRRRRARRLRTAGADGRVQGGPRQGDNRSREPARRVDVRGEGSAVVPPDHPRHAAPDRPRPDSDAHPGRRHDRAALAGDRRTAHRRNVQARAARPVPLARRHPRRGVSTARSGRRVSQPDAGRA